MIVRCNNCNKQFDVNSNLIPEKGRLLECSSCNHQWFFKKDELKNNPQNLIKKPIEKPDILTKSQEDIDKERLLNNLNTDDQYYVSEIIDHKKTKIGILNLIIVFIISFTTLIIMIDTFKQPISFLVPNIEFILYNLYETLKDLLLFFKDLI